jgi:hypothetical protein
VPESTFWSDIDRLTSANHKIVHRDKGTEVLTSSGLIQQLRDAVATGLEVGGSSSAFGSRPTIDTAAQDLLLEIGDQARKLLQRATGLASPIGQAERHIRLWAAAVRESELVEVELRKQVPTDRLELWLAADPRNRAVYTETSRMEAWRLVKHWIGRVEGFFYPPDTREIKAACPICEERWVHRQKDGQTIQSPALMFVREEGEITHACCMACGRKWSPTQFDWLAGAIGAIADEKALEEMGVVRHADEKVSTGVDE